MPPPFNKCVLDLLLYDNQGKQLRSCQEGQLLNHTIPRQAPPEAHDQYSVRNKQLPTCPSRVEFAGGKLKVSEGCPPDNMKFQKIILFQVFLKVTIN